MKLTISKRSLFISIISLFFVGGYYYYSANLSDQGNYETLSPADLGRVYLSSYSETGFLFESPNEGEFWRFEIIRPVFEEFYSEDGRDYIKGYVMTEVETKVPVGIYVGGEIEGLDSKYKDYTEFIWIRSEYDNESLELSSGFGENWSFLELQEKWNIKSGDQFEVFFLASGPETKSLGPACEEMQYFNNCLQSILNADREWSLYEVSQDGAAFDPNETPYIEVYPYFIGQILE